MKAVKIHAHGPKPRVYSYLRFSTPEQKLGDSERRQMENAKSYAEKNGHVFDEQLRDEGVSGWSGKHVAKGNLGRFLERVKSGDVPTGSILFVEEIDRLSREEMTDALETIVFGLIKHGITVVTPTGTYDRESLNTGGIWRLIAKLQNAHDESQKKSERLGGAWAEKKRLAREEKRIATSRGPHWLNKVDGRWEKIPEAVKTVQLIFKLAPVLGRSRLVKKLNRDAPWTPRGRKQGSQGNGWRMSYVQKILSNPAVLGIYQPYTKRGGAKRMPHGDPIPDYYPKIIEPAAFYAIQKIAKENKARHRGGRTGAAFNLFARLARCAYCEGPMTYRDRGPLPKGGQYLICDNAERGTKCKPRSVRYAEVQEVILNNCAKLRPEKILPAEDERVEKCEALRTRINGAEGEQAAIEAQILNLVDQISRTKGGTIRDRYQQRIADLEREKDESEIKLEFDRNALVQSEKDRSSFLNWRRDLEGLMAAIGPKTAVEARIRLQSHLREFISKIEIFSEGFERRFDPDALDAVAALKTSDDFVEAVGDLNESGSRPIPRKKLARFLEAIVKRRMSKEGRFYRVYFTTGACVDVVPSGSLASGEKLVEKSQNRWRFVHADLDTLWRDFSSSEG